MFRFSYISKMKINQRYHNQQQDNRQNIAKSKVLLKYKNHLEQLIQDDQTSFNSIQTPGWTSLVATEQSKITTLTRRTNKQHNQDTHIQILNRLNSLPKLNTNHATFDNIRLNPSLTKNKNVIIYASAKFEQKKSLETPKSKRQDSRRHKDVNLSNKFLHNSQKLQKDEKRFLNRFNTNKPQILFRVGRSTQRNQISSPRKRISSVRSQPQQNLKERIKERISMGNYKPKIDNLDFQLKNCIQTNEKTDPFDNQRSTKKFYSQIHAPSQLKDSKNEYYNRYMNKLNQRTKETVGVKIFKKNNQKQKTTIDNKIAQKLGFQKQNEPINSIKSKRFNSITVYDHLYKDHMKLQSKRNMEKIIDDSYKKATTLTFTPFVSEKSNYLAESKFSRQSTAENQTLDQEHCLAKCYKTNENKQNKLKASIFTIQEQATSKQKQKMNEKFQQQTLSRLFYVLSNNTSQINQKSLQENIEKLPLSLLELLEPILTEVYKKVSFSEKQFLGLFFTEMQNDKKKIYSKRQVIVFQTERFLKIKVQKQEKNKENQMSNK